MSKSDWYACSWHLIANFGGHGTSCEKWQDAETGEYVCYVCTKCKKKWGDPERIKKYLPWEPYCVKCESKNVSLYLIEPAPDIDGHTRKWYFCADCQFYTIFKFKPVPELTPDDQGE